MTIKYKRKILRSKLILGLLWLIFGMIQVFVFDSENKSWFKYGWFVISLMYLFLYIYESYNQYITIEKGILKINSLFGKKINLNEIKNIKKIGGNYILKTDNKALTINTDIIDPDSLNELKKLNAVWE
jgi:hypothetical protein